MNAKIVPTYASGCFCARPVLTELSGIPYRPRFEFAKAVRQCAAANNMKDEVFLTKGTKSAVGMLEVPCAHRDVQTVRFDWHIDYSEVRP